MNSFIKLDSEERCFENEDTEELYCQTSLSENDILFLQKAKLSKKLDNIFLEDFAIGLGCVHLNLNLKLEFY